MRLLHYIFLLFGFTASAQTVADNPDFAVVDSIARTHKYKGDLKLLVSQLTDGYNSDLLKARAIFAWVTDNIAYDVKAFNKNKKPRPFKCRNKKNCEAEFIAYQDKYIEEVLNSGKGVCQGYSNLFKRMCDYAGLQTDVISGYVKTSKNMVGKMGTQNHAWIGIIIDGKYYYIDPTWAAGSCTEDEKGKLDEFIKGFDEFYWLTPIDKFYIDHYPADETPYTSNYYREKYKNAPYVASWLIPCLNVVKPESGVIQKFIGDTIHFEIAYDCDRIIDTLQINTNRKRNPSIWADEEETEISQSALKKQEYINFTIENNILRFDYVLTDKHTRYIEVFVNHRHTILKFNVTVVEYLLVFCKKLYKKWKKP